MISRLISRYFIPNIFWSAIKFYYDIYIEPRFKISNSNLQAVTSNSEIQQKIWMSILGLLKKNILFTVFYSFSIFRTFKPNYK